MLVLISIVVKGQKKHKEKCYAYDWTKNLKKWKILLEYYEKYLFFKRNPSIISLTKFRIQQILVSNERPQRTPLKSMLSWLNSENGCMYDLKGSQEYCKHPFILSSLCNPIGQQPIPGSGVLCFCYFGVSIWSILHLL